VARRGNPDRDGLRIGPVSAPSDWRRTGQGLLAGLITGFVAVGVGQLIAGIARPQSSPVAAVGSMAIDFTPPPVKNFAISAFGSHDKLVLVSGVLVILAGFAAVIGALAMRRFGYGLTGLAVFALIGLIAALTRPDAELTDALPTLLGAAAAAFALSRLVRAAEDPPALTGAPAGSGGAIAGPAPVLDPFVLDPSGPARADDADADGADAGDEDTGDEDTGDADQDETGLAGQPGWDDPALPWRSGWGANSPYKRRPAGPAQPARRSFLVTSTVAVAAGGVSLFAGRVLTERSSVNVARSSVRLPAAAHPAPRLPAGSDLDIKGLSPFITPNGAFYRVDTALILPEVSPQSWQLRIHGMVDREISINFKELLRRPLIEDYVTLTCVSNPVAGPYIGNALWLGASLADLLRSARVKAGADQLLCTSVDGFTSGTPIQTVMDGRDALLAVAMNGSPLPVAHGFPVRMVTPGLYGYVSATKWVTDIKVTTFAAESAYWAQRGWSQQAPIKTESRIDVPTNSAQAGRTAVAGVAWAQHKGIDAVHVRVDGGPWQQARLAAVPDIDTWRQWVWEWDATPGRHTIEARATDATGYTQTGLQEPPEPNGASGYPSVTVTVT
jgi:DMSO/TMAO reductase YedYZ molybdopterin-dependent catalytic subunit